MYHTRDEPNEKVERAFDIAKQNKEAPTFHAAIQLNELLQDIRFDSSGRDDRFYTLTREFRELVEKKYPDEVEPRRDELQKRRDQLNEALNDESDIDQQTEIIREQEHVQEQIDKLNAEYEAELRALFEKVITALESRVVKQQRREQRRTY